MPELQVRITRPYILRIPSGDYEVNDRNETLRLDGAIDPVEGKAFSTVALRFVADDSSDTDYQKREKERAAKRLLAQTNRLLRWYRVLNEEAEVTELSFAQASPFEFGVVSPSAAEIQGGWLTEVVHEITSPARIRLPNEQLTQRLTECLATEREPDVPTLFLLDAEWATENGRFREAVLFCWSTIDSTFNRHYADLVDRALQGESEGVKDFFKGNTGQFSLRFRMTAGLHLVARRSLAREPDNLWQKLTSSYEKRNGIVHRGELATEADAKTALEAARKVVEIMEAIQISPELLP